MNSMTPEILLDILTDILKYEKFDTLNVNKNNLKIKQGNLTIGLGEDYIECAKGSKPQLTYSIKYKISTPRHSDFDFDEDYDSDFTTKSPSTPLEKKITYQDYKRYISGEFPISEKEYEDIFQPYRKNMDDYNDQKNNERLSHLFNMHKEIIDRKISNVVD